MKLMSFKHKGRESYGAVVAGGVVDLGRRLGKKYPTLKALLAGNGLAAARALVKSAKPDYRMSQVSFLPVITAPDKILAIGLNYADHAAEAGIKPPSKPVVFVRFANSHVGHEQAIVKPKESEQFDYEVELCIVIGRRARRVAAKDALKYVAGYTIYHDGSVRDWQFHGSQFTPGKNFVKSGAVGPWLVTSDELKDPSKLRLTTKINGRTLAGQHDGTAHLPGRRARRLLLDFHHARAGRPHSDRHAARGGLRAQAARLHEEGRRGRDGDRADRDLAQQGNRGLGSGGTDAG